MRRIDDHLGVGDVVDGRDHAMFDAEPFVDDLDHRCQAVGGAAGVRDDLVAGLQRLLVHPHDDHGVDLVLRRDGQEDLLGAGLEVLGARLAGGEDPGGLHDEVDLVGGVGQVGRVTLGGDGDLLPVDGDRALTGADLAVVAAVNRVVRQQVSQGGCVGEVVDGHDLHAGGGLDDSEDVPSDAAEAVDTNVDGHDCCRFERF